MCSQHPCESVVKEQNIYKCVLKKTCYGFDLSFFHLLKSKYYKQTLSSRKCVATGFLTESSKPGQHEILAVKREGRIRLERVYILITTTELKRDVIKK